MLRQFVRIILLLAAAAIAVASDASLEVREHEKALAKAIRAKQTSALLATIGHDFHASWQCGSGERTYSVEVHREDWISDLVQMRVESYEAEVSDVRLMSKPRPDRKALDAVVEQATVDEVWTIRSARGGRVEKRFVASDLWVNEKGVWSLVSRMYGPNSCISR